MLGYLAGVVVFIIAFFVGVCPLKPNISTGIYKYDQQDAQDLIVAHTDEDIINFNIHRPQ